MSEKEEKLKKGRAEKPEINELVDRGQERWDDFDKEAGVYTFPSGNKLDAKISELGKCYFGHVKIGAGKEKRERIGFAYSDSPPVEREQGTGRDRAWFHFDILSEETGFEAEWKILGESGKAAGEDREQLIKAFAAFKKRVGEILEKRAKDTKTRDGVENKRNDNAEGGGEPRERRKAKEPFIRPEQKEECLKYLEVRRELRKRWEEGRGEYLQEHPLEEAGLSPPLIRKIVADFHLERVLPVEYNGSQFVQRKPVSGGSGAEEDEDDNIGNKAEPSVVVVDDEEIPDLTPTEKEEAMERTGGWDDKYKFSRGGGGKDEDNKREGDKNVGKEYKEERKNIERYRYLAERNDLDKPEAWDGTINRVIAVLAAESGGVVKEKGVENNGLIKLRNPELPTLIISDIHARRKSLLAILEKKADDSGKTFFDYLKDGKINIVCLGDGMHSEGRAKERWKKALKDGFQVRTMDVAGGFTENFFSMKQGNWEMNAEMVESLNTARMIMDLKIAFSDNFHFLRGNHDDILGEDIAIFKKYAEESEMALEWARKMMGDEFVKNYARFEHSLPLALSGKYFLASHSGPKEPLTAAQIRAKDTVAMRGVTHTKNEDIVSDTVLLDKMMEDLLPDTAPGDKLWFMGHRPVADDRVVASADLAKNKDAVLFFQLNNPKHLSFAVFDPVLMSATEKRTDTIKFGDFVPLIDVVTTKKGDKVVKENRRNICWVPEKSDLPPEEPTLAFVEDKALFAKK